MRRPQVTLSPEQVVEVETLAALLSQEQIADYFGIGRSTFKAICQRDDEEVLVRYKRGKAKAIAHVANGLLQKARAGCKTSSIFYLKTQAGWRETAEIPDPPTHGDATGAKDKLKEFLDNIAARSNRIGVDRRYNHTQPECMCRLLFAIENLARLRKSLICIRPLDRLVGRGLDGVTHAPWSH